MIKYLLLICLSLSLINCKKENPLQINTITYDLKSEHNCTNENCTYVHIEAPQIIGNEVVSKLINEQYFTFVQEILSFENDAKTNSYDTLALNFIKNYNEAYRTYPENALPWEANFNLEHKPLSLKVYQFVCDYFIFTGGAHGSHAVKSFIIDLNSGKTIPKKELFINFEGFKKYAEAEFRKQMNIPGDLNEAGFTFADNKFKLSENFYETKTDWILHYNAYEIAPYVQGSTIIKLPKQEVATYLNPLYFKN